MTGKKYRIDKFNQFLAAFKRLSAATAFLFLSIFLFLAASSQSIASAQICTESARIAATRTGVPISVLRAISLTETGRNRNGEFQPWPWTVNMDGKGVWFDSDTEALNFVTSHFNSGARSFDVGCFQINYRWHGHHFASIKEMFDPEKNALYAARFLNELYAEMGNWTDAAGAFHSRTPEYADKYKKRFARIHQSISDSASAHKPSGNQIAASSNTFPLLRVSQSTQSLGSLVPISQTDSRRFIDN